ncbi:MAG: FAD-binding oxidoreductase [Gordonia sp. (in: high G+C Gram-positive bacteria)]
MANHARHVLHRVRDHISQDPDRFVRNVLTRLFAINPDLHELFPATMTHLRDEFFHVIDHVLDVVPGDTGHDDLIELLAQLGRDHRKYGVVSEHYDLMYQALISEFRSVLADYWDDDTAQAVSQTMLLTTGVMRGAAQMAPGPTTWNAKVVEKYRITRDLAVIRLISTQPQQFSPGQYLEVQVPQRPRSWRNLSPAIPPNPAGELEFHVRSVRGGTVSMAIVNETVVGDTWQLAQSHGTLHIAAGHDVLMVAGGTGLAPLRALLIDMSRRADAPATHIFYGVRYPGELYDLVVLARIASTNPWLRVTAVSEESSDPWWIDSIASPETLGIEHRIGTLADVVASSGRWDEHQALIAGSPAMVDYTRRRLIIAGVRASMIQHDAIF